MLIIPVLETQRLIVRPFALDDLDAYHQINADVGWVDLEATAEENRELRRQWLQWTVMNYDQLARLYQPPYGDRAVVLKQTNHLIGACGLVPCLGPFGQLPYFGGRENSLFTAEMGLFWIIAPALQGQGYATEAAQALIDYAFGELNLARIIATTAYDNAASMGVMRRLGMRIEKNPQPDPHWLQVVGILENKGAGA